ncbi:PAS domain S-box protein [Natronorubrum texcoconense]|uniref:histidine kinase n=1 Tax=Natronorubrum texcoconense TaxID=1095776 RepID=A0A1G9GVJ7_9EURY|nr:PAS domain S-box protein [Natronorubrum texcoconense]SDL04612.1 PAS domain S-box-containing protein [Natronorubrum texcoconense]
MTERRDQQLQESEQQFRSLVDAVEEYAIFMLDPEGYVVTWNEGARQIKGYEREEILGEHFSRFYTDADRDAGVPARNLDAAADSGSTEDEGWRRRKDGTEFWANVRITTVRDDDGSLQGYAKVTRDMTDRRERERKLQRERNLTDRILETSPVGIQVLDTDGEITRMNERLREILDVSQETAATYEPSDSVVYDEAGTRLSVDDYPFAQTLATGEPVSDRVLRIERPGGDDRWLSTSTAPLRSEDGEIDRVVASAEDVTDLKERERRLERRTDELSAELSEVYGRITDGLIALDEDWIFTHVNDRGEEILGIERANLLGETLWDVFPELIGSPFETCYREAMESQESTSITEYYPALDTWFKDYVYPSETGLSIYFRDVSEQKVRERERDRYETLVETIDDGVYALDADRTFTLVNDGFLAMTGFSRDRLLGAHASVVFGDEFDAVEVERSTTDETDANPTFEETIRTATGEELTVESRFALLEDEDVRVGVTRDITERKERERILEESEQRYRTLVDYFPGGLVTLFDHDLRYTLAAGQGFDRIPVEPDDIEGKTVVDAWPDDTADALEPIFRAALEGEEAAAEMEYADREWRVRAIPITDERGDVFAGMTMSQDITEQKAYERYLEDAKAQLEAATEAGAVGTWEWQIQTDRFVTGASFARTFGLDPDAAREGVPLERIISSVHEADRERVETAITDAVASCGEYEEEYRVWNADGKLRWVVARGYVETDETGTPETFPGAITDITDRKRAEIALEKSQKQLQTLFELLPVGVVVANADGQLVEANDAAKEIWGGDVFDAASVEEYEQYTARWAETGESVEPGEWTMSRVLEGEVVTDPDIFEIEAADGEERIVMIHGMPVRDANGEISRGVVTQTEITERREYQRKLEETVSKLETSNERLEQFAYAASHDLQEPLRMVSSYLQLVERRYGDDLDDDGEEFLAFAIDGADRMREMIDGLLAYSRVDTQGDPLEPIDLETVVADALEDLQLRIDEERAEITVESLPRVRGDANQLRQVFQNLLSNALEYSDDEPRVRIESERNGGMWTVSVSDDGIGMDPAETHRIFEVFQRLHSRDEHPGTGIGLALCQRILERHGGEIRVDSTPGEGSTFSVSLPAVDRRFE